jgi:membrane protein
MGEDLWSAEIEPRNAITRVRSFLQFAVMIGEGFVRDRLLLRASALSYFTILSLIPLVAVAVALVGSFGVSENLAQMIVEVVAAGSPEAQRKIVELIEGANFGGLGTLGAAALFLTTVLGISNVEKALNAIWGVRQQRSWVRRLPDYLAVLVVAPLMLGTALSLAGTLESQWLVQRLLELRAFSLLHTLGLAYAPLIVLSLAFAFVFWFLPNTSVRVSSALLGGLVAGVLGVSAQKLYLGFSIGVAKYNALFGGFAALPLLFVWIYIFCAIALFGAEVAFAHQNLPRAVRGDRAAPCPRGGAGVSRRAAGLDGRRARRLAARAGAHRARGAVPAPGRRNHRAAGGGGGGRLPARSPGGEDPRDRRAGRSPRSARVDRRECNAGRGGGANVGRDGGGRRQGRGRADARGGDRGGAGLRLSGDVGERSPSGREPAVPRNPPRCPEGERSPTSPMR